MKGRLTSACLFYSLCGPEGAVFSLSVSAESANIPRRPQTPAWKSGMPLEIKNMRLWVKAAEAMPETEELTEEKVKDAFAKNWNVIVWNDPVNLMSYVVFVFMKVLAFPKEKATKHMLEVHHQGKSCVATETKEKAELYHQQLQSFGLTVTIEQV
jgi:ATP-dependent Clp protease adaptor protein ClpS